MSGNSRWNLIRGLKGYCGSVEALQYGTDKDDNEARWTVWIRKHIIKLGEQYG